MRSVAVSLPRGVTGYLLRIVLVAATYYVAGVAGLELALVRGQVSPIWPATGVALFFLLRFGLVAAPGIAIGALAVNFLLGPTPLAVVAIMVGNTLAPVTAYLLLRRVGFQPDLRRLTDALTLVGLAGFTSMAISATFGTTTLLIAEAIPSDAFWPTWLVWWAGDTMGVLIVAPVLLLVFAQRPAWLKAPAYVAEAALLLVATAAAGAIIATTTTSMLFLSFIPLTWAAVRFQQFVAAPCTLLVSLAVTLAASDADGPFAGGPLAESMLVLHAFNGTIALVTLLLSAAMNQRNLATAAVEETCRSLADTIGKLAAVSTLSSAGHLGAQNGPANRPVPK